MPLVVKLKKKSTEKIVEELQQGHNEVANFDLLFDYYYYQLYRFFQRKGISPEDCKDLTQEVFLSVYTGLKGLRSPEQFESWLFQIAKNIYSNEINRRHMKKRGNQESPLDESQVAEPSTGDWPVYDRGANPMNDMLEKENRDQIGQIIRMLPTQMSRCVQLKVLHGLSNPEIADVLGVSVKTVKAHLYRAKKVLKEKLGKQFPNI